MASGTVARDARAALGLAMPDELVDLAYGLVGTPEEVKGELSRINTHLGHLYEMEPDMAIRVLAAYSPRVTELERQLFYAESGERAYARIRTMDVRPLLDEIDRQFKMHSRLLESRAQDLAMEGIRR